MKKHVFSPKYDDISNDELCALPPSEVKAFVEFHIKCESTEADLSPGELRLLRIIRHSYARWKK